MSKRTHQRQLERARSKRATDRFERRRRRTRMIAIAGALLMAFSVVAAAVIALSGDQGDSPTIDEGAAPDDGADDGAADDGAAEDEDAAADEEQAADDPGEGGEDDAAAEAVEPCPDDADAPSPSPVTYEQAPPPAEAETVTATLETTCGEIVLTLDGEAAPMAVGSFAFLAEEGFYEGVAFHRVIEDFVVQGGDPTGTGTGGPGYQFDDELDAAQALVEAEGGYPRGSLAMANSGPDTNGSQFFIVLEDLGERLPPDYTYFGEVAEGMDVVDRIAAGEVSGDRPVDPVRIRSVTVERS